MFSMHAAYVSRIELLPEFSSSHVVIAGGARGAEVARRVDEKLRRVRSLRTLSSCEGARRYRIFRCLCGVFNLYQLSQ